jgi:O-antigen/teichoic acid export membrane protein
VSARAALSLGSVQVVDFGVQMLLPMLLVRQLGADDFGVYRTLWLLALSASALLAFNAQGSLVYWIAQRPASSHAGLVANVWAYLAAAAGLTALVVSLWLPGSAMGATLHLPAVWPALFCALWLLSLPFDQIAIAGGQAGTQAALGLLQSLARLLLIGGGALLAGVNGVVWNLLAFALLRTLASAVYARRRFHVSPRALDRDLAGWQARYALAFGLGGSLWSLRAQADGWVAAAWLGASGVAAISVAATVVPLVGMVRQALVGATVSRLAQSVQAGAMGDATALVRQCNLGVALFALPMVGGFVAVAPDAISLLYTPAFHGAAGAARVFAITQLLLAVEVSPLVQALGHGRFALYSSGALLLLGAGAATGGAWALGLVGIPLGALAATLVGSGASLWLLRHRHGLRVRELVPLAALLPLLAVTALACTAAMVAALTLSPGAAPAPMTQRLSAVLLGLGVFVAVYGAGVWLWPATRASYALAWQRVRPRRAAGVGQAATAP